MCFVTCGKVSSTWRTVRQFAAVLELEDFKRVVERGGHCGREMVATPGRKRLRRGWSRRKRNCVAKKFSPGER